METPSFKDLMKRDVSRVFLNPAEFAEEHLINGTPMAVILDDNENIEREKRMKSSMDGIFARQMFLYVSAEEYGGPIPPQGRTLKLDGKTYTVVDATDESGVYTITLEANKVR